MNFVICVIFLFEVNYGIKNIFWDHIRFLLSLYFYPASGRLLKSIELIRGVLIFVFKDSFLVNIFARTIKWLSF